MSSNCVRLRLWWWERRWARRLSGRSPRRASRSVPLEWPLSITVQRIELRFTLSERPRRPPHPPGDRFGGAMQAADMILVSVDDHLVEPPDVFDGRLPARLRRPGPQGRAAGTTARTSGSSTAPSIPNIGPQRRRRPPPGGVRHRADGLRRDAARLLRRPRAHQGHERRWCPRLDELPVLPGLQRPAVRRRRGQGLALAVVRAYNDWHIDEWCGSYPGRFIPMALPVLWDAELARRGGPAGRRQGRPLHDLHREPGRTWGTRASTTRLGSRCGRPCATRAWSSPIHLGSSGQLTVTAPDAPVDVMITLQPMNIC